MKAACLFILATILASASAMPKMMSPSAMPKMMPPSAMPKMMPPSAMPKMMPPSTRASAPAARDSLLGTYTVKVQGKKSVLATASVVLVDASTVFVDWTANSVANLVSIELATATGAPIGTVFSSAAPVTITGKASSKASVNVANVAGGAKTPMDNKGVVLLIRTLTANYTGVLLKEGKSRANGLVDGSVFLDTAIKFMDPIANKEIVVNVKCDWKSEGLFGPWDAGCLFKWVDLTGKPFERGISAMQIFKDLWNAPALIQKEFDRMVREGK